MKLRLAAFLSAFVLILATIAADAQPGPRPPGGGNPPGGQPPAGGQPAGGLLQKITPEQMSQILSQAGYKNEIKVQGKNKFIVTQFFPQLAGLVALDVCDQAGCSVAAFLISLGKDSGVSNDWVNAWNINKPFVTAALDKDGSLLMIMYTHLFGGVTATHLAQTAQVFVQIVNQSTDFQPPK